MVIPIKTVTTLPVKGVAKFPYEFDRAMNGFSSLPLWFTLPIIFAASFAVGIVVALLL